MDYSFGKKERLNSKIAISQLFTKGSSFFKYPFKVVYLNNSAGQVENNAILVSVSKRNFKNAVDRNKIKRSIREAYRLNKHILSAGIDTKHNFWNIGFVYTAKSILPYKDIERKIILILQSIKNQDEVSAV